jgi:hypothetical protein
MPKMIEPEYMKEFAVFSKLFDGYASVNRVEVATNMYVWSGGSLITLELRPVIPAGVEYKNDEQLRTILFWQMQECLRILDVNGIKIIAGPSMEIRGDLQNSISGEKVATVYEAELSVTIHPLPGG